MPTIPPRSLLLAAVLVFTAACGSPRATIRIDSTHRVGPTNGNLLGLGWNTGRIESVQPLTPRLVRVDADLPVAAPSPGVFATEGLLTKIARVRDLGAEPLVILYPLPEWLGQSRASRCDPPPPAASCDPTRVRPDDLQAWENVIAEVVRRLASADAPAFLFETWNEPDLSIFWQDTPEAFLETAEASHRAVRRVAEETRLPLRVGGPAALSPDFAVDYVDAIRAAGLPIHFASWHHYGNSPLLGPDGAEGMSDPAAYAAASGINEETSPETYGQQTRDLRNALAGLSDDDTRPPELILDEWNISPGGLDRRHDSHEGAAYVAASLIEMERAGLDRAAFYRSNSDREEPGDWGILDIEDQRKPSWWAFRAFEQSQGHLLSTRGDDPTDGLWARAPHNGGTMHVFLSTFRAAADSSRDVLLEFDGPCTDRVARIASIHADSRSFEAPFTVRVGGEQLLLFLPNQSLTWLEVRCEADASSVPLTPPRTGS